MPVADGIHQGLPNALVAIPGTGSDADYIRRSFGPAAARLGIGLVAAQPGNNLVEDHLAVLDEAADRYGQILVGGVSIGAAIAVEWALSAGSRRCAGVLAALPAWSGAPDAATAAASASATADALERDGLEPTIATMAASSPDWLADELGRSWRALSTGLVGQLRRAAGYRAPTETEIAALAVPLAITAAVDDPIHPLQVARDWARAAPRAELAEVTLGQWGHEPALLGDSCTQAWLRMVDS